MNTTLSPYVRKSLEQLENIYAALRLNNIAMSKSDAMKIVGGRYKLERLVNTGKIRLQKTGIWESWVQMVLHGGRCFSPC